LTGPAPTPNAEPVPAAPAYGPVAPVQGWSVPPPGAPVPGATGPVVAPPRTNGFAVASLIFGIMGGFLFGLIFGFIGLSRAKKVGGNGRVTSWIGIGVSMAWIVGIAAFVVVLVVTPATAVDTANRAACDTAIHAVTTSATKMGAANGDKAVILGELQATVASLEEAEGQATDANLGAAIRRLASDYQELYNAINTGSPAADDVVTRAGADGDAIDTACARF
jgi:hypothetical protein